MKNNNGIVESYENYSLIILCHFTIFNISDILLYPQNYIQFIIDKIIYFILLILIFYF